MIKLFETFGLTYPEMVDVTTYILLAISIGVFMGKVMYECLSAIADIIFSVLDFLFWLVRKHLKKYFPNVRKNRKE